MTFSNSNLSSEVQFYLKKKKRTKRRKRKNILKALFTEPFYIAPPKKKHNSIHSKPVYDFQGWSREVFYENCGIQYVTYCMSHTGRRIINFRPSLRLFHR